MLYKSGPILVLFENYIADVFVSLEAATSSTVHKLLRMREK